VVLGGGVDEAAPFCELTVGRAVSVLSCLRCRASLVGVDIPLQTKIAAHDRRRMLDQRIVIRLATQLRSCKVIEVGAPWTSEYSRWIILLFDVAVPRLRCECSHGL
jgi:hypothetical protein